jgi:hypothetical protein
MRLNPHGSIAVRMGRTRREDYFLPFFFAAFLTAFFFAAFLATVSSSLESLVEQLVCRRNRANEY